ncbi:TPA: hypothetical protein HA278_01710 [Candidatus Woesearchaeota archaeon]|nr:hypothetical protein [Candidatus Woesearchaeota archaeon]
MHKKPLQIVVPDDDADSLFLTKRWITRRYGAAVKVRGISCIDEASRVVRGLLEDDSDALLVSDVHMGNRNPRTYTRFFDAYRETGRALPTILTTTVLSQRPPLNTSEPTHYHPREGETLRDVITRTTPSHAQVLAIGRERDELYAGIEAMVPDLAKRAEEISGEPLAYVTPLATERQPYSR